MVLIKNGTDKPVLTEVTFDKTAGFGKIVITGDFLVHQGVDDPVIEIFNAVQLVKQTAAMKNHGKELVNFTPLFPDTSVKGVTSYQLMPSKPAGVPIKKFLNDAKETLNVFYKDLFIASFNQFLNDDNDVCNYNGYSLYHVCMERIESESDPKKRDYDIRTIRMLLENFINFIGLPLPRSKEAYERQAAIVTKLLEELDLKDTNLKFLLNPKKVVELIYSA